jgi:hypothetical protein
MLQAKRPRFAASKPRDSSPASWRVCVALHFLGAYHKFEKIIVDVLAGLVVVLVPPQE